MSLLQQKRLYEAERCLWGHGRDFSSIEEVSAYLQDITTTEWFVKEFRWIPPIEIRTWNSNRWAGCADRYQYIIYLKRRKENVILHELSHLLCSSDEHDQEFTGILTYLVRNAMGFYAWAEFSYELEKVEYYAA